MKFRTKPSVVEAITFDELVQYGRDHGANIGPDGMPWSFDYRGRHVTEENKWLYLVTVNRGNDKLGLDDILVIDGDLAYITDKALFYADHDPIDDDEEPIDKCEGCNAPATTTDSDGVPLCNACFNSMIQAK